MVRSTAGKARVGIVWIVTVGMLFLIAAVFAFISQSEISKQELAVKGAEQALAEKKTEAEQQADVARKLSAVLGWYDRAAAGAVSDPAAAQKSLENLKTTFTDLGAAEKDYESALPKIIATLDQKNTKNAELETRIKGLESELAAAQKATTDVSAEKDTTIAGLRQQVADEQKNAQQRTQELEGRLSSAQAQVTERDGELRKTRDESVTDKRKADAQKAIDDARIAQLAHDTAFAKDPFWNQPDGRVLEVSDRLGTGWIDIGANKRVVRGMRFEVRSGRPGSAATKAWAEVTNVKPDSAEVVFSDLADKYSPVVAGDVVLNKIYDPVGDRNAVLIGRFSGSLNETDLKALLEKMAIHVQAKIDKTTHFLIVGSELWNDPQTGEPLSEPMQPSELPAYKQAESLGVQIVPLQDIRDYFRLGAGQ